jgi:mono/diheme cytochrome c family protein
VVGDPTAGATVYSANCVGCHASTPSGSVLNGSTVAALNSAFQSIQGMNRFSTSLSETDKLNLAAYIQSR